MADDPDVSGSSTVVSGNRFRNWKAVLDLQPIVQSEPLRVAGEYHLGMRCGGVSLRKAIPQGFNPQILLLELVESPGDGGDWINVEARFAAKAGQYDSVMIRDMDEETTSVDVQEVH
jgi:hypothetical protein